MKSAKMLKTLTIVVLLTTPIGIGSAGAASAPTSLYYGDVPLSGDFQTGHFPQMWDLTACDLTLSFTYDANGLVDDFGGSAHAWAELGVRTVGYDDFNPTWDVEGAGVWLATDYDWVANTFDPDPPGSPTLDLDDKLILQKAGGHGEGDYNLPSTPPNPGANHRVWWDRDGVDPWQNDETANTGGIYNVEITLQATSGTSGDAYININGLNQGFETDGNWNTIELTPAGMTFTGDMTQMQVFYGLYGYGATHSVEFRDITVSGCLVLEEGMVTGGGWIDSPAGAYMPGPISISGTFTGETQTRFTDIKCNPNESPVTFTGWVEVTGVEPNGAVMFGLVDAGLIDTGDSGWFGSAYAYFGRIGTNVRIGPSDGFYGGELNQVGANVPYMEGGTNHIDFSMTIYQGQITVSYNGVDYVDTYGEIEDFNTYDAYPWSEFDFGAYIGIDGWPDNNSVDYDISITGCEAGVSGKATFGFIAKNKKGGDSTDGQTEFMFKAGELNFHSTSYDWLVFNQGKTNAQFKGSGTINGGLDPNGNEYRFMIWAGDGDPDTFGIKIWWEDTDSTEHVMYFNGKDQPISGGSIVIHTKKK